MLKRIVLANVIIFVLLVGARSEDNFYYSNNQQYQLTPLENRVVIGFKPSWVPQVFRLGIISS